LVSPTRQTRGDTLRGLAPSPPPGAAGSVARRDRPRDTKHQTPDPWHQTPNTQHQTPDTKHRTSSWRSRPYQTLILKPQTPKTSNPNTLKRQTRRDAVRGLAPSPPPDSVARRDRPRGLPSLFSCSCTDWRNANLSPKPNPKPKLNLRPDPKPRLRLHPPAPPGTKTNPKRFASNPQGPRTWSRTLCSRWRSWQRRAACEPLCLITYPEYSLVYGRVEGKGIVTSCLSHSLSRSLSLSLSLSRTRTPSTRHKHAGTPYVFSHPFLPLARLAASHGGIVLVDCLLFLHALARTFATILRKSRDRDDCLFFLDL